MIGSTDFAAAAKACRHLLRHLHQPAALHLNPLLRAQLNGTPTPAAVRDLIEALAAGIPERERAIVLRCDLERQPHKTVARDLGLSMRQFYRDRGAMIDRLALQLVERTNRHQIYAAVIDVAALEAARARLLQYGGHRETAVTLLRGIAASTASLEDSVAARCAVAGIFTEQNSIAAAEAELHEVARALAETPSVTALAFERMQHERRNMLWCSGREREACLLDEAAAPRIAALAASDDAASRHFAAGALTMLARRAFMCGRFILARELLERAHHVLTLQEDTPIDTRIHWLLLDGVVRATLRTGASRSKIAQAGDVAVKHGLSELAVLAAIGLSIEEQMHGAHAAAFDHVHRVVPLARTVASALNRSHVFLRLGEMQAQLGRPHAALAALAEARAAVPIKNYAWTYNNLIAARTHLVLHEYETAKDYALSAAEAAATQRNERTEGTALMALAESYVGLNATSAAVGAIESSIVRLERSGYPLVLMNAYRIGARLTGRRHYTRFAEELEQLMKSA